ncbi:M24 family metallopeptidase [Proteinivorax hydrogeniformans]|uniref:M24 family metallopeptidase n=1 Tax=Proteinivorax hydrogeniformans TaxID=1826727 RepID=A0AAU8HUP2_9FIRM
MRQRILSLRQQGETLNRWLNIRMKTILPELMERAELDMWIVIARENNEDQILSTLIPAPALSARRRTILVFSRNEDGTIERLNLGPAGSEMDLVYNSIRQNKQDDQWLFLRNVVKKRNPKTIGVNISETFAGADGLSSTDHKNLLDALKGLDVNVISAEKVAVGWLEQRIPEELEAYHVINRIAHDIIAEAFSSKVIVPGQTTTLDVVWWIRQRIHDLGLRAWFQPTVDVQRQGEEKPLFDTVIRGGDLLHCDVGLHYLGLSTDTQQLAYVRRPGEEEAPSEFEEALAEGNKLQDITANEFITGRTGNEILANALEEACQAGLKARVYTHPIGFHGHGSGPTIGLYEKQDKVAGAGEYPLYSNTCYALELNVVTYLTKWQQEITIPLEQTVAFSAGEVKYLGGRQSKLHLV